MHPLLGSNHLLNSMVELIRYLRVVVAESLELSSLLDPVGKVFDHLSFSDIENLGSYLCKTSIIFPEILVGELLAASELNPSTRLGEYNAKVLRELPLKIVPSVN